MKLPSKIKIGHITYSLSLTKEPLHSKGVELWGLNQLSKAKITVSADVPEGPHQAEIVFHEALHGLMSHFEILQMEGMNEQREEFLVSTLAKGIIMLLVDNPELVKYLAESVKEKK